MARVGTRRGARRGRPHRAARGRSRGDRVCSLPLNEPKQRNDSRRCWRTIATFFSSIIFMQRRTTRPLCSVKTASAKRTRPSGFFPLWSGARWHALRRQVRKSGHDPSDERLHRIRIKAKQLRYAAEAATPVMGKAARRTAKICRRPPDAPRRTPRCSHRGIVAPRAGSPRPLPRRRLRGRTTWRPSSNVSSASFGTVGVERGRRSRGRSTVVGWTEPIHSA